MYKSTLRLLAVLTSRRLLLRSALQDSSSQELDYVLGVNQSGSSFLLTNTGRPGAFDDGLFDFFAQAQQEGRFGGDE
jgi:hypothetical protein